ncbi:hypothetical protein B0H16DRAFT_40562 [Mycena metata]|uniref:F-box domain-containing protein n=1 Tax=Mycena metata TaxID=1033252 RepID=A0AAD7KJX1_9AGAR|nr:hypothetical protein B0H16DRAFT_40562 [Mycena metata]
MPLFFSSATTTTTPVHPIMSTVPHLPLEVVIHILEEAYLALDPHTILQATLVCRDWSVPAQKLLFSAVTLASQTSCLAFAAAVDRATPRGCMLGDAVLRMRVVLDHNQPFGLSQHSFAHAVIACPNLLELNLALYGSASPGKDVVGLPDLLRMRRPAPSFDETTLELLRSGPSIRALTFANWSENQTSVAQLLDVWPSLKALTVSGTPPKLPGSTSPFSCALEQLRMNFQTSPSVDFMKWLLHNSAATLRVLELEREPSPELLEYLVEAHGETLRSLALPAATTHDHAQAVHKCMQLQELRVEHAWATPLLYKRLPAGLQHLALALDQDTALQPVLDAVRSGNNALRAVTLQVWESGEQNPQLPVLKLLCAYRGIELKMTKDIRVFRAIGRGDRI